MPAVRNVLVVGGGAAGTAAAILLAEGGVSVDLVDIKPDVGALGSGITLQGNALRVLRQLGVWEQVAGQGYAFDTPRPARARPAGTLDRRAPRRPDRRPRPAGDRSACTGPTWPGSCSTGPPRPA